MVSGFFYPTNTILSAGLTVKSENGVDRHQAYRLGLYQGLGSVNKINIESIGIPINIEVVEDGNADPSVVRIRRILFVA